MANEAHESTKVKAKQDLESLRKAHAEELAIKQAEREAALQELQGKIE